MNFTLFIIVILFGGWVSGRSFDRLKLPSVLGMTLFGVLIALTCKDWVPDTVYAVAPFLKGLALVVILLRAGLGIKRATLKKVGFTALALAFIPCTLEALTYFALFYFGLDFSFEAAGAIGFLLSAVSPAVVVPSMLELKEKGYGKKNDVPTLVLAGASVDDVFAISLFSIFLGLYENNDSNVWMSLLQIPMSLAGGVVFGLLVGFALLYFFKRNQKKWKTTEKTLLTILMALLLLELGSWTGTATLLGVMVVGFVLLEKLEVAANEIASKLSKFWLVAQIWLFVLIGLSVDVSLVKEAGIVALGFLTVGLLIRSLGVWVSTSRSSLSLNERKFVVISYLPKATVQAAMGSVPLAMGMPEGEMILAIAVLSIIFTAPLGLLGIRMFGTQLLQKG